jgi:hypothetical protein
MVGGSEGTSVPGTESRRIMTLVKNTGFASHSSQELAISAEAQLQHQEAALRGVSGTVVSAFSQAPLGIFSEVFSDLTQENLACLVMTKDVSAGQERTCRRTRNCFPLVCCGAQVCPFYFSHLC